MGQLKKIVIKHITSAILIVTLISAVCLSPGIGVKAANTGTLRAIVQSSWQVRLEWDDNLTAESDFRVERKTGQGPYTTIAYLSANSTQYYDNSLQPGYYYTYRIMWSDSSGRIYQYTNELMLTANIVVPPDSLNAVSVSTTQVDLSWSYPQGAAFDTLIERRTADGSWQALATIPGGTYTYSDTEVSEDFVYYYRACAVSGNYILSRPFPNEYWGTPVHTGLVAPSHLHGYAVTPNSLMLLWNDGSGETAYVIERKSSSGVFEQIATLSAGSTGWYDNGLQPNALYTYRVKAVGYNNFTQYTNEATIAVTLLETPTGLAAFNNGQAGVELHWRDMSLSESSFEIWRRPYGSMQWELAGTAGANSESYIDPEGIAKQYIYKVRAAIPEAGVYSMFTNEVAAATESIAAPQLLDYTVNSPTEVLLRWLDRSSGESAFIVERRNPDNDIWVEIALLTPNTTKYADKGILPHIEYQYRIKAVSSNYSYASYSETIEVVTGYPPSPSNLRAEPVSSSQIKLTWTDNSDDETGFIIERRLSTSRIYREIGRTDANAAVFVDQGLSPGTRYIYRVYAYNKTGKSEQARESAAMTRPAVVYTDVPDGYWAKEAIIDLGSRGVLDSGNGEKFRPGQSITRAEFVGMVVKAFGLEKTAVGSFKDVRPDHPYYNEIMTAGGLGIITGNRDSIFHPDASLSRQDMVLITIRTLKIIGRPLKGHDSSVLEIFPDSDRVSDYASAAMASAVGERVINFREDSAGRSVLRPTYSAIRAEAAWLIYNVIDWYGI